MLKIKH